MVNGHMVLIIYQILEKLLIFKSELRKRRKIATNYINNFTQLNTKTSLPLVCSEKENSWAQFTIILPELVNRDLLQKKLLEKGIPTAVYYPIPLHKQKPYQRYHSSLDLLKNTIYLCKNVISLPMHPYLTQNEVSYICKNFHVIINEMI